MTHSVLGTLVALTLLVGGLSSGTDRGLSLAAPAIATPDTGKKQKAVKVNINTATREQLVALAGIGEAYADKIIAGRPYQKKSELVARNVMPDSVYAKVKTLINAKPAKP